MLSISLFLAFPILLLARQHPHCLGPNGIPHYVPDANKTSDGKVPYACFDNWAGMYPTDLSKPALPNFDLCLIAFDRESNGTIPAKCKPNSYFVHMCESALVLSEDPVSLSESHIYGLRGPMSGCEEDLPNKKYPWDAVTDSRMAERRAELYDPSKLIAFLESKREMLAKAYDRLSEPDKRAFRIAEGGTH